MLLALCALRTTKYTGSAAWPRLSGLSGACSAGSLCLTANAPLSSLYSMHVMEPCHNARSNMLHIDLLSCQALIRVPAALLPGKPSHRKGLSLFASGCFSPSRSTSAGAGHSLDPPQMCARHLIHGTGLPCDNAQGCPMTISYILDEQDFSCIPPLSQQPSHPGSSRMSSSASFADAGTR